MNAIMELNGFYGNWSVDVVGGTWDEFDIMTSETYAKLNIIFIMLSLIRKRGIYMSLTDECKIEIKKELNGLSDEELISKYNSCCQMGRTAPVIFDMSEGIFNNDQRILLIASELMKRNLHDKLSKRDLFRISEIRI